MTTYYPDVDGDGYGDNDAAKTTQACAAPTGYVTRAGDCCDVKGGGDTHPGSTSTAACQGPNACGSYDYNCDGNITKTHSERNCVTALDTDCWHTVA